MRITRVEPGGHADQAGIRSGDELLSVDGRPLKDAIDLTFTLAWTEEPEVVFELSRRGVAFSAVLAAEQAGELGFEVQEAPVRTCGNNCVFCFVDQLPRGLRGSLYIKDEDYRLSFSYGNYITLTNLSDGDYERIAEQRLSPLYVSVHATDDEVRRAMLGRDETPPILESLHRLGSAGIRVHAQAVLCPGTNDGEVLERTLADLFALGDMIESIAIVPVGLTAHRQKLPVVDGVSAAVARETLETVERWQERFLSDGRDRTVYAADELFLRAGRALPASDSYGGLPQLENGVGLLRSFESELNHRCALLGDRIDPPLTVTLVTARLAEGFIAQAVEHALGQLDGLTLRVVASDNTLLGPTVAVAGLLPGADMIDALRKAPESDAFLLPGVAFNDDGVTLDGMTVREIADGSGRESVMATDDLVGALLKLVGRSDTGSAEPDQAMRRDILEKEGR